MVSVVRMPAALAGVTEAAVQTWVAQPGQQVAVGDLLAEIETEKAVVEYVAEVGGTLARLLVPEGSTAEVGAPIAVILEDGEGEDAIGPALEAAGATASASEPDATEPVDETDVDPHLEPQRQLEPKPEPQARPESQPGAYRDPPWRFASPLVRRVAQERGVDLAEVPGTGPHRRIVRRDLERFLQSRIDSTVQAAPPKTSPASAGEILLGDERVPLTGMRSAIARRLTESKTTVPHFYVTAHCRVDDLLQLRNQVNAVATRKVSVNDFVVKAVAGALREVPEANATWGGDHVLRHRDVDVAVAVALDDGLLTPVVRQADRLPLLALSEEVATLASRARTGGLLQKELEGGAFTVSNLGMYGVDEFAAILNPPQSGILAVAAAKERPVVVAGEVIGATMMTVTLSADHRVVDGAVAARWMQQFVRRMENPILLAL